MTEQELRKLKRSELLEIMLAQSREIDSLRAQLSEKDRELKEKNLAIKNAGSIAEASLAITNIFTEAQRAADIYLLNVKRMCGESGQEKDPDKDQEKDPETT